MIRTLAAIVMALFVLPVAAADLTRGPTASSTPIFLQDTDFTGPYIGLRAGGGFLNGSFRDTADIAAGANAGYDFGFIRAEAAYDRYGVGKTSRDLASVNGILQARFGDVVPYALVGVGHEWIRGVGVSADKTVGILGGGLRYTLNRYVEIDARYRLVRAFDQPVVAPLYPPRAGDEHLFTVGANFTF